MALPREPRQKMINMMYLVLTALLALNVSSEILNAFKTVNKSLENTNATVNKSTETIMESLKDKTTDPVSAAKAQIWYPKAQNVQNISKNVFTYIQSLKDRILTEAGGDPKKPEQKFKEDNLDVATRIMIEKGEGPKLLATLDKYKKDLLAIDPSIDSAFKSALPINLEKPASRTKAGKTWEGAYFHMVPTVAALTILSKFQNDVKTTENRVVQFCHNRVGEVVVRFDTYAAIIGQNSTYLMPGQDLEIKAGVGAFSTGAKPKITIGGRNADVASDGNDKGTAIVKIPGGGVGPHDARGVRDLRRGRPARARCPGVPHGGRRVRLPPEGPRPRLRRVPQVPGRGPGAHPGRARDAHLRGAGRGEVDDPASGLGGAGRRPMAFAERPAGVAKLVDATDLNNLSAPGEIPDVEPPKLGEPCQMAIPSQAPERAPGKV